MNQKRKARYRRKLKREWDEFWHKPIGYFVIEDREPEEGPSTLREITQSLIDNGSTVFASFRWEVPAEDLLYPEMVNKTFWYVPFEAKPYE